MIPMRLVQHWYAPSVAFRDRLPGCTQCQLSETAPGSINALSALSDGSWCRLPGCTARLLSAGALHHLLLAADY